MAKCSRGAAPHRGPRADVEFLKKRLRAMLSDVTFLDAYQRTNRFLNVTVTAADTNEPPRMLNYLTAPHVIIWSAVAASSAFPGLFPPQDILARDPAGNFVGCGPVPHSAFRPCAACSVSHQYVHAVHRQAFRALAWLGASLHQPAADSTPR